MSERRMERFSRPNAVRRPLLAGLAAAVCSLAAGGCDSGGAGGHPMADAGPADVATPDAPTGTIAIRFGDGPDLCPTVLVTALPPTAPVGQSVSIQALPSDPDAADARMSPRLTFEWTTNGGELSRCIDTARHIRLHLAGTLRRHAGGLRPPVQHERDRRDSMYRHRRRLEQLGRQRRRGRRHGLGRQLRQWVGRRDRDELGWRDRDELGRRDRDELGWGEGRRLRRSDAARPAEPPGGAAVSPVRGAPTAAAGPTAPAEAARANHRQTTSPLSVMDVPLTIVSSTPTGVSSSPRARRTGSSARSLWVFPRLGVRGKPGGDPLKCWCGDKQPPDTSAQTCLTDNTPPTQANGPCLQQILKAAKSMDAATVRLRFSDPAFPLGAAVNLMVCRGTFCAGQAGGGDGMGTGGATPDPAVPVHVTMPICPVPPAM